MPGQTARTPERTLRIKPKVFIDTDVLFAGNAAPSEHRASLTVLRMAEITLVKAYVSQQVLDEAERVLQAKLPQALPAFRMIVSRCIQKVPNPEASEVQRYAGLAERADLPILVAALQAGCPWLVSFHTRHYQPGHPDIICLPPGDFLLRVRDLLARMA
jgi:predicted nucleic acid-binding protein